MVAMSPKIAKPMSSSAKIKPFERFFGVGEERYGGRDMVLLSGSKASIQISFGPFKMGTSAPKKGERPARLSIKKFGSDRSRTCNPLRGDRFRGGSLTIRITSTMRDQLTMKEAVLDSAPWMLSKPNPVVDSSAASLPWALKPIGESSLFFSAIIQKN